MAYSIQYKQLAEQLKNLLKKKGKKITNFQQVLGCSKINFREKNILLISSGEFHSFNLYNQNKDVIIFDGTNIYNINKKQIKQYQQAKQASLNNYYHAKNIGILVSTKPGQQNLKKALDFRKNFIKTHKNKNSYIFLADNINTQEFENFPIQSWVNTACPGLALNKNIKNKKIINLNQINN